MCVCVCFKKNRVDAILIGCRCYKNAQPLLQEQIDELGMWERMKAKIPQTWVTSLRRGPLRASVDEKTP